MQNQFVQGDILFVKAPDMEHEQWSHYWKDSQFRLGYRMDDLGSVVAEGEKTGHKHIITGGLFKFFSYSGHNILFVPEEGGVDVKHDEHGPVHLERGSWVVTRQISYDYEAASRNALELRKEIED